MSFSQPVALTGSYVTLRALGGGPPGRFAMEDGQMWNTSFTRIPAPDQMMAEIHENEGTYHVLQGILRGAIERF